MPSTFERLRDILVRDYSLEPDMVTLDAEVENLGVDSLGLAELLFTIEDEFKVTVSRDPVPLATVAEVVGYIDGLIAAQSDLVMNAATPHLALPG